MREKEEKEGKENFKEEKKRRESMEVELVHDKINKQ